MTEPVGDGGPSTFLDSLGDRGLRRAEPRTSIAVAGAGCALGVLGVLVIAGDTGLDDSSGDFNQVPGVILSALVVAAGFFVLARARRGPIATAGAVAAALGVPPLMFFLTFDEGSFPPYSTQAILIVSTLAWLAAYAIGPGRGRPFFLGAGLIGLWFTVLQLTEKVFTAPFGLFGGFFGTSSVTFEETGTAIGGPDFDPSTDSGFDPGFNQPDVPDPTTIGMISLAFGVTFLLLARFLDRRGRHGTATPFTFAALPCLAVGVATLTGDLEQAGTGLLMVVIGLGLAYHGATVLRRFTTWVGGAVTAIGLAVFLGDMAGDDATVAGMLFLAGGIGLVFVGHAVATALREPDEMVLTSELVPVTVARVSPLVATPEAPLAAPDPDEGQWAPPPPPPPAPPATDDDDPPPA